MLSAQKIGRRHIEYYLSYAQRGAEGFWVGAGAADLGLAGAVRPEDFLALSEGVGPGRAQLLERVPENRTPGWDFTFSAPKSVSVCFALGDDRLRGAVTRAHHDATRAAIHFLERHGGRARRGLGGRDGHVTAGLAVACFTHPASRELDPQLHTHGLVLNVGHGKDGRWTAIDSRTLYLHKRAAASIYRAELRSRLAALGANWQPPDRRGLAEISGMERETLRAFSTRRAQIEERLAPGSSARAAEVACIATRRQKVDAELAALTERWRSQAQLMSWSEERVCRLLDGTDRRQRPERSEQDRTDAHLLSRAGLTRQAAAFTRDDAVVAWAEALVQGETRESLEALADSTLRNEEVVPLVVADPDGRPLTTEHRSPQGSVLRLVRSPASSNGTLVCEPRYSTRELLATEAKLLETALGYRRAGTGVVRDEVLSEVIASRPHLSDEQREMVRRACTSGDLVEVAVGVPGSGKTFALEAARVAWTSCGYRVIGAALSATAAAQLQAGSGISSSTFDSLRNRIEQSREQLDRRSVVVIDESGMLDTRRIAKLVSWARESGAKVFLVGDDRQLPAIETGGAFAALARRLGATCLSANARQVSKWERNALVALREGRTGEAAASYERHGRINIFESAGELLGTMVARWWDARGSGAQAALFSYSRDAAWVLNTMARACLESEGLLSGDELVVPEDSPLDLAERRYRSGDEVLCLRNSSRLGQARDASGAGVRNGTRGMVESVDVSSGELVLRREDSTTVRLPASYVRRHTDYSYAWTLHKGQGQTVGQVKSKAGDEAQRSEGRAFVYGADTLSAEAALVAASRATDSTELFVLVDPDEEHDKQVDVGSELAKSWARSEAEEMASDELEAQRRVAELAVGSAEELSQRRRELTEAIGSGGLADPASMEELARRELGAVAVSFDEARADEEAARERASVDTGEARAAAKAELRELRRDLKALEEDVTLAISRSEGTYEVLRSQERARGRLGSDLRRLGRELELVDSALATRRFRNVDALCADPPDYAVSLLGKAPGDARMRLRWRQGLVEIEDYRGSTAAGTDDEYAPSPATAGASPWTQALGEVPEGFEARRYHRVVENIRAVRRDIGIEQVELPQAADGSGPAPDMVAAVLARARRHSDPARRRAPPPRGRGMER